jgi:hypothetical protein
MGSRKTLVEHPQQRKRMGSERMHPENSCTGVNLLGRDVFMADFILSSRIASGIPILPIL